MSDRLSDEKLALIRAHCDAKTLVGMALTELSERRAAEVRLDQALSALRIARLRKDPDEARIWLQVGIDFLENDPEVMAEGASYATPSPPAGPS